MKTTDRPVRLAAIHAGCALVLCPLTLGIAFAANPPSPAPAVNAPKTHVLFMGADIALEKGKTYHPVEDVAGTTLVIRVGDKPVKVPQSPNLNLGIKESLKLAATSVTVDHLETERTYTSLSDPFRKVAQAAALAAGDSAVVDAQRANLAVLNLNVAATGAWVANARGTPDEGAALAAQAAEQAKVATAEAGLTQTINRPAAEIYDVASRTASAGAEASRERFDAIRVTFDLKTDKDLAHPYYAVIAQIREPESKPKQARRWAYVRSLEALPAGETRKVTIYQGGMPPGYLLESCEVHVYNGGNELATNLSRKRVPLTDEEAMDYRIIDYVSVNKGRTLPATPASMSLANEVRALLTPAQLSQTCYVRVAKGGRVIAAFRDPAGQEPLADAAIESALKTLRFKPALEAGKPVESIAPIVLDQLASP